MVGYEFDEQTLDRLVQDSLVLYKKTQAELEKEGYIVTNPETGNEKINPKYTLLEKSRAFVKQAWSTKFRENAKKPKEDGNHFSEVDLGAE